MRAIAILSVLLLVVPTLAGAGEHKARVEAPETQSRGLLDCSAAIPLTCGETIHGDNTGAPSNVSTYSCDCWEADGPEVVYEFTIGGASNVAFSARLTDNDPDIDLYLLGSCDENDCYACGDMFIYSGNLEPGTYYLVAEGYQASDYGEFEIETQCFALDERCCPSVSDCVIFDFGAGDNDVTMESCGPGDPTWEWGTPSGIPTGACDGSVVGTVLGTTLTGDYPDDAGDIAIIGPVTVTENCTCLELCHWYEIEDTYDGGNVKVSTDGASTWELLIPQEGYSSYAWEDPYCVGDELVFAQEDDPAGGFFRNCFDLCAYVGQDIHIGFFFGSDGSYGMRGWYIDKVILGTGDVSVERSSWGAIKALYR
jgi:hypothetical protein